MACRGEGKNVRKAGREAAHKIASTEEGTENYSWGASGKSLSLRVFLTLQVHLQQTRAIERALSNDVAFILGPCGTDRMAALCDLAGSSLQEHRSVLFVAQTTTTVDHVFIHLVQMIQATNKTDLNAALKQGQIVRAGTPRHNALLRGDLSSWAVNVLVDRHNEVLADEYVKNPSINA